jgi:hypothetical protein
MQQRLAVGVLGVRSCVKYHAHRPWRLPILKCIRLQQLVGTCTTGGGCTTGVRWLLHGCDCHRRTLHFVASAVVCCCRRSSVAAATARTAA